MPTDHGTQLTPEGPGPVPVLHRAEVEELAVRPRARPLVRWVERNPGLALALAAGLGIVVGRLARTLVDRARR